jgi:hypothetical protein
VPAVGEDPAVVAVVEDLERHFVPAAQLLDEPLVTERREQLPRSWNCEPTSTTGERVSLHIRIIG